MPRQKERIIIDDYEFDIINVGDTRIGDGKDEEAEMSCEPLAISLLALCR